MTALIVIANLVLFVGSFVGAFMALAWLTSKTIGFFHGARMAALTQGDIEARKRFGGLTAFLLCALTALSAVLFLSLGQAAWSTLVLAPSIGALLGLAASYKMNFHQLKPTGWK